MANKFLDKDGLTKLVSLVKGDINSLKESQTTTNNEIASLKTYVSDKKSGIASAITDMGQTTASDATFDIMMANIKLISSDATAGEAEVLAGKTFYQGGVKKTGTMPDKSNLSMGVNLNTQAIKDITTGQFVSAQGSGSQICFNLHFSGYVTPNTQVRQQVFGLHPSIVKAGELMGAYNGVVGASLTGTYTSDATATADHIISGKTAYVNGVKLTGTIVDRSSTLNGTSWTNTNGDTGVDFLVPKGYYDGATKIYAVDNDLVASNIKTGINIFGVNGSFTSDATATSDKILAGYTAYVNGVKVTGTMTNTSTMSVLGDSVEETSASDGIATFSANSIDNIASLETSTTGKARLGTKIQSSGYFDNTTTFYQWIDNLFPDAIRAGVKVGNGEQYILGNYTSDANATASDLVSGKTAYVNGAKVTGSMTDYSASTGLVSSASSSNILNIEESSDGNVCMITIGSPVNGYVSTNTTITQKFYGIHSSLVKAGTTIGSGGSGARLTGTYTSDANATVGDLLSNKTAYVNGKKIVGSMPNYAGVELTGNNSDGPLVSGGTAYANSSGYITNMDVTTDGFTRLGTKIQANGYISSDTTIQQWIYGLTPDNIRAGVKVGSTTKYITGTYTSDANANADKILKGYTAYVNGTKLTGNVPDVRGTTVYCGAEGVASLSIHSDASYGRLLITPSPNYKPWGVCDYSTLFETHLLGLIPSNIRAGVSIAGSSAMTGTFTSDANATASQILSGYSAYVNGNKVNGGISISNPDYSDQRTSSAISYGTYSGNSTPYLYFAVPNNTYLNGVNWVRHTCATVASEIGLTADKIVSGQQVLGIWGSGGNKRYASGTSFTFGKLGGFYGTRSVNSSGWGYNSMSVNSTLAINTGVSFTPSMAKVVWNTGSDTYWAIIHRDNAIYMCRSVNYPDNNSYLAKFVNSNYGEISSFSGSTIFVANPYNTASVSWEVWE